jgi:hypothetical protein
MNEETKELEERFKEILHGKNTEKLLMTYWEGAVSEEYFSTKNSKFYFQKELLESSAEEAWVGGPCYILALALKEWLGKEAQLCRLGTPEGYHAFVQTGEYFIDGTGFKSEEEILEGNREIMDWDNGIAYINSASLKKWSCDMERDKKLVVKPLTKLLAKSLDKERLLKVLKIPQPEIVL